MRRTTIALLAGLEASVAALIGLGIVLVPLMLLWAVHFGLAVDAALFLRAAADVWLLGHGVDVVVQLDALTAGRIGLPGAGDPFPITIALLGFALMSVASGRRIGVRSVAGGHAFTGAVAAIVVYALVGGALALTAQVPGAMPSLWQAVALPAFAMALGVVIGAVPGALGEAGEADATSGMLRRALALLPASLVDGARVAVRIGAGAAFGVLTVAAVAVAVLIAADYATIAGLGQSLGAGIDGGIALTVAELSLVPNFIIWAAAWLLGPGFAIGAGTEVSPGGTVLGPMPGIPILGALPSGAPVLGALWLIVPVLFAFVGAWVVRGGDGADLGASSVSGFRRRANAPWWQPAAIGVAAAVVAAMVLGLLAWWSGGAAGPGRLAEVGPDPWAVAMVTAATVGIGAIAGAYAAWMRRREDAYGAGQRGSDAAEGALGSR
ncbi:CDP-archaeol synthase [Agromyces ramosus]|uniref:Uncharacterized protein n=1 Tax=Agromyces ramosus TaxID=33879 RepID=A0ABU0R4Z6_9MICO|nr:CDP-archaeol synthase [Agromyces ramosus]MDQ0893158.1 hypothetical protein [Agromyces ramosus]